MQNKYTEYLGYIGMILVVGSFLFNPADKMFIIINLIGAIITAIYSVMIKSKPVLFMNIFIAIFDILHLFNIHINEVISNIMA